MTGDDFTPEFSEKVVRVLKATLPKSARVREYVTFNRRTGIAVASVTLGGPVTLELKVYSSQSPESVLTQFVRLAEATLAAKPQ